MNDDVLTENNDILPINKDDEEQQIYINQLLEHNIIKIFPLIKKIDDKNILEKVNKKVNELLKLDCGNIKYIPNPTFENWMIIYNTTDKIETYLIMNKKHDPHFCKVLVTNNYKLIEYIIIKNIEICNIVFQKIVDNCDYDYLGYIPKKFITKENIKTIILESVSNIKIMNKYINTLESNDAKELYNCLFEKIYRSRMYSYFSYIPKEYQTEEMKENLVLKDGYNLQYIYDFSLEICKKAVDNKPDAIKYVNERWKHYVELCLYILEIDPFSIKYFPNKCYCPKHINITVDIKIDIYKEYYCYDKMCLMAMTHNTHSLEYIKTKFSIEIYKQIVKDHYVYLEYMPYSYELYEFAIKTYLELKERNGIQQDDYNKFIEYIINLINNKFNYNLGTLSYYKLWSLLVEKDGLLLKHVKFDVNLYNYKKEYENVKNIAVKQNENAIEYYINITEINLSNSSCVIT